jgi:hypothetical protein
MNTNRANVRFSFVTAPSSPDLERGTYHGLQGLWQEGEDPGERRQAQLLRLACREPRRAEEAAEEGQGAGLPQGPRHQGQEHPRPQVVVTAELSG